MPFWMQSEDPSYYAEKPYDPEDPYEDGDHPEDDEIIEYYGA